MIIFLYYCILSSLFSKGWRSWVNKIIRKKIKRNFQPNYSKYQYYWLIWKLETISKFESTKHVQISMKIYMIYLWLSKILNQHFPRKLNSCAFQNISFAISFAFNFWFAQCMYANIFQNISISNDPLSFGKFLFEETWNISIKQSQFISINKWEEFQYLLSLVLIFKLVIKRQKINFENGNYNG